MAEHGLTIDRPIAPALIELSDDSEQLADPFSYPVKVRTSPEQRLKMMSIWSLVGDFGPSRYTRKTRNSTCSLCRRLRW